MPLRTAQNNRHEQVMPDKLYVRRERRAVTIVLVFLLVAMAHFVHDAWVYTLAVYRSIPITSQEPRVWLFSTTPPQFVHAPEAYRVAMPWLGSLVRGATHQDASMIASEFDLIFGTLAVYLFYRLMSDSLPASPGWRARRLAVIGTYLVFAELAIRWTVLFQRPETMPSAAFVAFALFCLKRGPKAALWTVWLLAATAWQAFTRSDVAAVLGVAIALAALTGRAEELGPRIAVFGKGAAMAAIAVATQAYLQFIRFPHLTYWPGTTVVQLTDNLKRHTLGDGVVAVAPFFVPVIWAAWKNIRFEPLEIVALIASVLYLLLWFSVGSLGEVRIFVPFLLALSMVAGRVGPECLLGSETSAA